MKNFLSFFSPKNLGEIVKTLWTRFPISSVLVLINTGFIWYQVNNDAEDSALIMRAILTLVVTFFLSASIAILGESQKPNKYTRWIPLLPIFYGVGFFFAIRSLDMNSGVFNEPFIYFSLHLVGFIAWIFFAPYVSHLKGREQKDIEYTNYFTQVAWTFCMSAIVGGALMALWSIAISAVGALFDINPLINEWKMYENWGVIALSLAAPLYGLIHLPEKDAIDTRDYVTNKFFAFIIRFVVIPFVAIYFCILYAYSVKVLLNISEWPKGEICWLVIGFSVFGYLGYIFSKSYEQEHSVVQIFRKYFPIAVLPQIPMLGYAIALRINQYDLTMNRYFVVVFGLWLTLISLYFILGRIKSLTIIPTTLTLLTLMISIGPWWVYQLPLSRQYSRLISNLEKAEILRDGKIFIASDTLDAVLENNIYSGIEYVCRFEKCTRIESLFNEILIEPKKTDEKNWKENPYNKETKKEYPGMNYWTIVSEVTKALGIEQRFIWTMSEERKYLSFNSKGNEFYESPLIVTGYERLYQIGSYTPWQTSALMGDYVLINTDTEELILKEYNQEIHFSLTEINQALIKKYHNTDNGWLHPEELTFILTKDNTSIKLLLQAYAIKNPQFTEKGIGEYPYIAGYALVK